LLERVRANLVVLLISPNARLCCQKLLDLGPLSLRLLLDFLRRKVLLLRANESMRATHLIRLRAWELLFVTLRVNFVL